MAATTAGTTGKYVLVPEHMLDEMERRVSRDMADARERQLKHTSYSRLRGLDQNIRQVLDDPAIDEDQKYAQYKRILQMHDNASAVDPQNVRQRRPPPTQLPPHIQRAPQQDVDLQGMADMFERAENQPPAADAEMFQPRAYNIDELRRLRREERRREQPAWNEEEVADVRSKLRSRGGAEILQHLHAYLGGEVDYSNVEERRGLRVGQENFPTSKLSAAINSIQRPSDYKRPAALALARLLEREGLSHLITNQEIQEELLQEQIHNMPSSSQVEQRPRRKAVHRHSKRLSSAVDDNTSSAQGQRRRRQELTPHAYAYAISKPAAAAAAGDSPFMTPTGSTPQSGRGHNILVKRWQNV